MTRNTTTLVSKPSLSVQASSYAAALLMLIATPIAFAAPARADSYQARINALQTEINQYQAKAGELKDKATTLQGELDRLANEKAAIQRQIDLSQAKYDQLVTDIKANEDKLAKTQKSLEKIVANLYVDDDVSSIELLASSENIADFVDKQEYRTAVQKRLASSVKEVKRLKKELEQQKIDVDRELVNSKTAREALAAKEAEQQAILDQTKGEEASYQQLSSDRKGQVDRLRAEQVAANLRAAQRSGSQTLVSGTPGGGGYPGKWANAPMNAYVDSWGLYSRQCVSYAAWKVASTGRFVPHFNGRGNANQWDSETAK